LVFAVVGWVVLASGVPLRAETAETVLAEVQRFYGSMRTLHAHTETVSESALGARKIFVGEVWLERSGKMRWSTAAPAPSLLVCDGQTLWMYSTAQHQVVRRSSPAPCLPLSLFLGVGDDFSVSPAKPKGGDRVLELVPKRASPIMRRAQVVVGKNGLIHTLVVYDQAGGKQTITLTEVELNVELDEALFRPPHP
jgi:outer membrane lipoprotein carrier protein